jgi:tetratricopeptide (TPR) repeat protein
MFGTNLKNYRERILKTTAVVFLVIMTFVFTSYGQNINDDLTPKVAVPKPTNKLARSEKSTKKIVKPIKTKPTRTPVIKPNKVAPKYKTPIISETSDEIIDRYLNYSQSASVTPKDWMSVFNQAQRSVKANPSDNKAAAQLLIAQGQIAYNQRNFSNALTQFNAAARVFPNSALPFYCIGKVYLVTKQPNEAKANFEKAIKINGGFALAYSGLGEALRAQGKSKKAQEYFQQASRIGLARSNTAAKANVPGNSFNNGQRNSQTMQTAQPQLSAYDLELRKARSLTATRKWQSSLKILLPLSNSNQSAEVFMAIGDNYSGMEQWLSAMQTYQKAVEINPNSAAALYKLGTVMFEMNEYQAAADAFEKSLIIDQTGTTINRQSARKMADRANEKAQELKTGKKKKFLGIGFN